MTESSSSSSSGHHMARQGWGRGREGTGGRSEAPRFVRTPPANLPTPLRSPPPRPVCRAHRPRGPAITPRFQSHFACHSPVTGLGLPSDCWIQLLELPLEFAGARATPTPTTPSPDHAHPFQDTATPPPSNHTPRIRQSIPWTCPCHNRLRARVEPRAPEAPRAGGSSGQGRAAPSCSAPSAEGRVGRTPGTAPGHDSGWNRTVHELSSAGVRWCCCAF